jgi:Uncharacterized protein conserved in bacteria (DUF2188)
MGADPDLKQRTRAALRRRLTAPLPHVLEVRFNRLRGDWEAMREGTQNALLFRETKEEAIEAAEERLRERGGGAVVVINHTGKASERIPVPVPSL